jgi:hypothetical protein
MLSFTSIHSIIYSIASAKFVIKYNYVVSKNKKKDVEI